MAKKVTSNTRAIPHLTNTELWRFWCTVATNHKNGCWEWQGQEVRDGGTVQEVRDGGTVQTYGKLDPKILKSKRALLVDRSGEKLRVFVGPKGKECS